MAAESAMGPPAKVESRPSFSKMQGSTIRKSPNPSPSQLTALSPLNMSHAHSDAAAEEYKMFISLVFGISIFGASTFAVAIGQMTDPADIWKPNKPPFTMQAVRTFLGAAWLCFVLTIAVAGFSSSFLTLLKSQAYRVVEEEAVGQRKRLGTIAIIASAFLWTLLVTAFLFLALAMVPYAYVPGWFAVVSTITFGLYVVWLIVTQVRLSLLLAPATSQLLVLPPEDRPAQAHRDQRPLDSMDPTGPGGFSLPPFLGGGGGSGSVVLSDVVGKERSINLFAGFTRDVESVSRRLDDGKQNSTVLAPLNSAVERLPRKPWEDARDYDTLGTEAYEGGDGQERARRNLGRFAEAHVVPVSPWEEGDKVKTLLGDREVWWETKDGKKVIQPDNIEVDSVASQVGNGEIWIIKGVRNYA